mgnify:CR=1 FL=1
MDSQRLHALNHEQIVDLIVAVGKTNSIMVRGNMGCGKSSLLPMIAKRLPTHTHYYADCSTMDIPDVAMYDINNSSESLNFIYNEALGLHEDKPIILMLDEYGKANPSVKLMLLRLILERKMGNRTLHPDSIVFATTNLGAEGVGDLLPPHARNRIAVVTSRKPSNTEWIEWGINNDIDHSLLGWCKDNPQLFASFDEVKDPDENPYIFHPKTQRAAFVTPRSLEAASDWLKHREAYDDQTLTAVLMGTIGERGAMDLMAFVKMSDQLPSLESIKTDPKNAKVPDSAAAVCMVVYRTLASLDKDWVNAWMDYLVRLDKEAQGMFANGVRNPKYSKQSLVMTNKKFTDWAMQNNYMFAADKA